MINPSKFVKIIRQKIISSKKKDNSIIVINKAEEKAEKIVIVREENKGTRYVGIDNTDLEQRVQHTIRNLMELDNEELAFIEDMNCRNMFEIVLLLNKVVATLVENMMAMNYTDQKEK